MRLKGRMADRRRTIFETLLRLATADKLRVGRLGENDPGLRTLAPQDAGNTGDGLGMPTFIAGRPRTWGVNLSLRY